MHFPEQPGWERHIPASARQAPRRASKSGLWRSRFRANLESRSGGEPWVEGTESARPRAPRPALSARGLPGGRRVAAGLPSRPLLLRPARRFTCARLRASSPCWCPPTGSRTPSSSPRPSHGGAGISGCQTAARRGLAGEGRGPAQASGNPGLPRDPGRGSRGPAPPGGARRRLRGRPMASEDGGGAGQWRARTAAQRGAAAECKHAGARGPPRAEPEPSAGRRAARSLPQPRAAAHRKAPRPRDEVGARLTDILKES
ncbi:uncharacterized protein LOC107400982 [Peromyscus maniculatus bairdii]|uniref:uncharacterized protein LOC107400982 n=1 Tax=Peromyscus maniculatus bairdii TaxID=230844 RepID=UPI003FD0DD31